MALESALFDIMDPLALLSDLLKHANSQGFVPIRPCTEIDDVHAELEKRLRSGGANNEPRDLQVEAVKTFWGKAKFESLREARLVSFGLAIRPWNDRRCLIEDPERFGAALTGLNEWASSPRQFRKCYQGLVRSYFDYDGLGRDIPIAGQNNWRTLQAYLRNRAKLIKDATVNPDWVACALENKGLFSETPCAAYAQDVLNGNGDKVKQVRELLGITDASWFTRELVLSQIDRACTLDHAPFTKMVDRLLALLGDNEVLRDRGLQMVLDRYVRIPQAPQHLGLKDYSVNAWGNPWLPSNEHRWGGVTVEARQMVGDWLKLEYIELFFTKLAQDGIGDTRRVKFWAQYVPLIENIHFALGKHARDPSERDFATLRDKFQGLTVSLEDNNRLNNAIIMTLGDLVAVEFIGDGNAFYGYSARNSLPFNLSNPVRSAPVNGRNSLKNRVRVVRLLHTDNVHNYSTWEDWFRQELQDKFGLIPAKNSVRRIDATYAAPAFQTRFQAQSLPSFASEVYSEDSVRQLADRLKATLVDHRNKGGALWVRTGDTPEARRVLEDWGFKYSEGKGWWKKDDG